MKWYISKLIFHICIDANLAREQFDESIRLVEANSLDEALNAARILGKTQEVEFFSIEGNKVNWKFVDVASLYEINRPIHGLEILSNTQETSSSRAYISNVHYMASQILADQENKILELE